MESAEREEIRYQIGWMLRQAREGQSRSLEDIARIVAIHAHQLEALERGDFDELPNPLWARGFLITYANHLGLDGGKLADNLFPRRRSSRPKRYLERHWRVFAAVLGAMGVAGIMIAAMILAPYNALTGPLNDFFHRIAPETFMGSGPQRVVTFGFTQSDASGKDNIVVVKIAQDSFGLLSIPRNTLTEIPGHGAGEIGDAFSLGGPDLTRRTVAQLTGIGMPHYLMISTGGVEEIVTAMDGVRVDVPEPVTGRASTGGPVLTLYPGPQVLNGDQALVYLQGRDLSSDVERAKRQQIFLRTMYVQALNPGNLLSDPATLSAVLEYTETNMSAAETIQLAARAAESRNSGAPLVTGIVPGRETTDSQEDAQNGGDWVPDAQELPRVLDKTLR